MRQRSLHCLLITGIMSLFPGCTLINTSFVIVCLPSHPYIAPDSWLLEYPQKIVDGVPVYTVRRISNADTELIIDHHSVFIARGENLPVFARPVFGNSDAQMSLNGGFPAAAVFPADISGARLELNWEDGFACEILRSCLLNSDVIRGFDTAAFRAAVTKKSGELKNEDGEVLSGGSWMLDPVPIISRLGYGLFRESSITQAEVMSFSIPVSEGLWHSDNPFYKPVAVEALGEDSEGILELCLPINRKTTFKNSQSGEVLELYFDDSSWCWTNLFTGASESGRR